jgi:HAE1 family hydrophobic/amphiphilic exporter-1
VKITELSVSRPSLVVVVFVALGFLGIAALAWLKTELLPPISPPIVSVTTVWPGAAPAEVETSLTKPIEEALSSVDRVKHVRAASADGLSAISLEFDPSARVEQAAQDVQRRVNQMVGTLPSGCRTPQVDRFALDELPVLRLAITAALEGVELRRLVEDRVKPRVAQVAGVGRVTLLGGGEREVQVALDPDRLRARGLSPFQVTRTLHDRHLDVPAGALLGSDRQIPVRLLGRVPTVEALRALPLAPGVRLDDVAAIHDGARDASTLVRVDAAPALGLLVQKQGEANSVEVVREVRAALARLEREEAGSRLHFDVVQDGSRFTLQAAEAVGHDLLLAVVLVALVMVLFLHTLRDPLIVMVAIPTSLLTTLAAMYLTGATLNLMTLLAMSLAIGVLVDDAMVVHENIARHLHQGKPRRQAALEGRAEIGVSAVAITLVDVVVFVPLMLLTGLIGNLLRQFAMVMVISTLTSLLVSFTLTPMLASRFAHHAPAEGPGPRARAGRAFEAAFGRMQAGYERLLRKALAHPLAVLALATAMLVGALALVGAGVIGSEFVAGTDRSELTVVVDLPPGSRLEQTDAVVRALERRYLALADVREVFTLVGQSTGGLGSDDAAPSSASMTVALAPKARRSRPAEVIGRRLQAMALEVPGLRARVMPIGIFGTADQVPVEVAVSGPRREDVAAAADRAAALVRGVRGTADVRLSTPPPRLEERLEVDHSQVAALGLPLSELAESLRLALTGDDDLRLRDGDHDVPVRVRLGPAWRSSTAALPELTFPSPSGAMVALGQVVRPAAGFAPAKLERLDRQPTVTILAQTMDRPAGDVGAEIAAGLARLPLPPGVQVHALGDLELQTEAFGRLLLAFVAAVVAVYLVLVALYDSAWLPLVVLATIPLAVVGALAALALTGETLNVFSLLGLIMLVGMVGKNAILLVDRTRVAREEGLEPAEAAVDAGRRRLRPILMTTVAMVAGMLPIALARGAGAEWKNGLAWVLIGGLVGSLLLTLVVVPVVLTLAARIGARLGARAWLGGAGERQGAYDSEVAPPPATTVGEEP